MSVLTCHSFRRRVFPGRLVLVPGFGGIRRECLSAVLAEVMAETESWVTAESRA